MHLTMGAQLRAARALLGLEKETLAEMAGVSSGTLRKFEAVDGALNARTTTLRALEEVFTSRGIEFYDEDKPGARLDLSKRGAKA